MDRGAGWAPWGLKRVRHDLVTKQQQISDIVKFKNSSVWNYSLLDPMTYHGKIRKPEKLLSPLNCPCDVGPFAAR